MPSNATAPLHSMPGIWRWLDSLSKAERPALLRGDIAYGNEAVLREAEAREQPYLTKLRLTKNVKGLIKRLFRASDWEDAGQGWEGLEDTLTLVGWRRARRVVVRRRNLTGEMLLTGKDELQEQFAFIEARAHRALCVRRAGHLDRPGVGASLGRVGLQVPVKVQGLTAGAQQGEQYHRQGAEQPPAVGAANVHSTQPHAKAQILGVAKAGLYAPAFGVIVDEGARCVPDPLRGRTRLSVRVGHLDTAASRLRPIAATPVSRIAANARWTSWDPRS